MKIAFGHLRITPREFWRYSLREWLAAIDGYMESLGADPMDKPLTRGELEDMMAEYPDA